MSNESSPARRNPVAVSAVPVDPFGSGPTVVALVESDSFLKWAAWLLDSAPGDWRSSLVLVSYPSSPTDRQVAAALVGTSFTVGDVRRAGVLEVRRLLSELQPDVVLMACTGPLISLLGRATATSGRTRPLVVAGVPGVALPVHRRAVELRRTVDVFVAHSHVEREHYQRAFDAVGGPTEVVLARLPFLPTGPDLDGDGGDDVVLATQARVPARPLQRSVLVQRLVAGSPVPPILKLRSGDGEATTHHEPFPYPEIVHDLVADGVLGPDDVAFRDGPMSASLRTARCLVTISSTAALEAMALGVPVLLADDFGVDDSLINRVFVGSGCLAPLTGFDGTGCRPDARWAHDNYLHPRSDDDWIERVLGRVGHGPSTGRAIERGITSEAAKAFVRSVAATARQQLRPTDQGQWAS